MASSVQQGQLLGNAMAATAYGPSKDLVTEEPNSIELFERLARDPNVPVEKIERLMTLWERAEARKAEAAFNAAMTAAQKAMRTIAEDAYNPQTKSRYASYEGIDRVLRPIYTGHGFGMTFNTVESPLTEHVRVTCKVTHADGHSENYQIDMPADGKGAKGGDVMTKTHATGSALSYGQRYLVRMIWNVATGEEDDDGNRATRRQRPDAPDGFDEFWNSVKDAASRGTRMFDQAWENGSADFKNYAVQHLRDEMNALKRQAREVKGQR